MTDIDTGNAEKEAWIADLSAQIQARFADQPEPEAGVPASPPEGLSPSQRMAWARQHGQVVPEFQLPEQPATAVAPANVANMRPVDRMRWVRGTLVK